MPTPDIMKRITSCIAGMILISYGYCQDFEVDFDSLPFSKPYARTLYYEIPHQELTSVRIHKKSVDYTSLSKRQDLKNFLLAMTDFFPGLGIAINNDMDVIWELSAELECNYSCLNWRITLLCTGKLVNERDLVDNYDGTYSSERISTNYYDWDNNSVGLIQEKNDTICKFYIIMDPRENPYLKPWSDEIYIQKPRYVRTKYENENYKSRLKRKSTDYAIAGSFRGNDFILITHGGIRKSYFYINKSLMCIFSPDVDDFKVKKQDRQMPCLLLNKSITTPQQPDWYRLAVMTRVLNMMLGQKKYVY